MYALILQDYLTLFQLSELIYFSFKDLEFVTLYWLDSWCINTRWLLWSSCMRVHTLLCTTIICFCVHWLGNFLFVGAHFLHGCVSACYIHPVVMYHTKSPSVPWLLLGLHVHPFVIFMILVLHYVMY